MILNLDMIQSMWEEDSKIDIDNLHEESLKVPQLHSKYHEMMNNLILLRAKEQLKKNIRHDRYEYFSGKLTLMSTLKIHFQKRFVTKTQCKSILTQMKNFQSINENSVLRYDD